MEPELERQRKSLPAYWWRTPECLQRVEAVPLDSLRLPFMGAIQTRIINET